MPAVDVSLIGKGLAVRLRDLTTALERRDGFAFSGRAPAAEPPAADDRLAVARSLVLGALRVAGDSSGWAVLRALRAADASSTALAAALALPRLVVWEQVNELVQAGLAARGDDLDTAGLTPAGAALVDLVEELAAVAAEGL